MIHIIPLKPKNSNFRIRTSLDGREFEFRFRWNERDDHFYIDMANASGIMLASGRKAVADIPLFSREFSEDFPPGSLCLYDTSGQEGDPGLLDLGDRVQFMYADEDSIA